MDELNKKPDGSLRIIAISLVIIAIALGYFAIKSMKDSRVPIVPVVDQTAIEINDAKNTTYNDSLVSIMIENTDASAKWSYFVGTAGAEIVEVNGKIPFTSSKDKILENLVNELSMSTWDKTYEALLTGSKFDASKIKDISFRIQFIKKMDDAPEPGQIYNRYYRAYAEVCITPMTGSKITVKANTGIFPFLHSCLNGGFF